MTLRRRSLLFFTLLLAPGCARHLPEPVQVFPVEALTNAESIRLRCERPEDVIAGRAFCVLKELPPGAVMGARPAP